MSKVQSLSQIQVKTPAPEELTRLGVNSWPVWTKEVSVFDWHYEEREVCYILEGAVTVKTAEGEISFGKGDLVTFPKGLDCQWQIKTAVRKHYQFG